MGYVVGPAELIAELRALRRLMLRHPPALIQRAFALFLSLGHYDALQRRLATAQRERSDLLRAALARYMPQCTVMPASGGGSCWVSLPERFDATELAAQARERGVLIEPGEVFFMADPPPRQHFRMGYSSIAPAAIEPGVKLLAELVRGFEHRR
jgi:GntR family transcriptional regulator/MocR family aminotransferase